MYVIRRTREMMHLAFFENLQNYNGVLLVA